MTASPEDNLVTKDRGAVLAEERTDVAMERTRMAAERMVFNLEQAVRKYLGRSGK